MQEGERGEFESVKRSKQRGAELRGRKSAIVSRREAETLLPSLVVAGPSLPLSRFVSGDMCILCSRGLNARRPRRCGFLSIVHRRPFKLL